MKYTHSCPCCQLCVSTVRVHFTTPELWHHLSIYLFVSLFFHENSMTVVTWCHLLAWNRFSIWQHDIFYSVNTADSFFSISKIARYILHSLDLWTLLCVGESKPRTFIQKYFFMDADVKGRTISLSFYYNNPADYMAWSRTVT